jgi:hypothetical protein
LFIHKYTEKRMKMGFAWTSQLVERHRGTTRDAALDLVSLQEQYRGRREAVRWRAR